MIDYIERPVTLFQIALGGNIDYTSFWPAEYVHKRRDGVRWPCPKPYGGECKRHRKLDGQQYWFLQVRDRYDGETKIFAFNWQIYRQFQREQQRLMERSAELANPSRIWFFNVAIRSVETYAHDFTLYHQVELRHIPVEEYRGIDPQEEIPEALRRAYQEALG